MPIEKAPARALSADNGLKDPLISAENATISKSVITA
jgi:hypothetical protein